MANGARNVIAAETNFTADVDAILKVVTPKTKLVWLANPNNPTGTYIPFDEVKRLRAALPSHGRSGNNRDYVLSTVASIEKQGFRDTQLHQLATMLHDAHPARHPLQDVRDA